MRTFELRLIPYELHAAIKAAAFREGVSMNTLILTMLKGKFMKIKPQFFQCGCCTQYHSTGFFGDCRSDADRFNPKDLDKKYGPDGWTIVNPEE